MSDFLVTIAACGVIVLGLSEIGHLIVDRWKLQDMLKEQFDKLIVEIRAIYRDDNNPHL